MSKYFKHLWIRTNYISDQYIGLWCLTALSTIFRLYRGGTTNNKNVAVNAYEYIQHIESTSVNLLELDSYLYPLSYPEEGT